MQKLFFCNLSNIKSLNQDFPVHNYEKIDQVYHFIIPPD